ncbi:MULTISPECIES: helix-turn-helix domain-containing protein [Pectobacterium]|uniref:helix-turn-helix domain-containing protein n=1 Tax=Pectobacterium TaxID=122277 RepID=UPI000501E77C|nr:MULTISPECIES: helix-turn-helix transcriptional regulator [Pectobacterium]KFX11040.1 hypothetical protein JV34_21590 [Pectobacterium atrosepticum]KMK87596.1 putative transcriptional regulator Nlp [Pectobacterium atrosepticum ICMP 1526]MCL6336340.1 transcriptional regulator [Pectobacterium carotovorum subsp. carotovorum]QXE13116.1 transcriptional regulator [Pectobacterium atrosepticum]
METKEDWHKADIVAAVHKKNTNISEISRKAGLSSTTLANALSRPWPKGEWMISQVIGVPPEQIWPSRYYEDGVFKDRQKRRRK